MKLLNSFLYDLPSPSNLTYLWNFGSLLGLFLLVQVLSGVFLSMWYSCGVLSSFSSLIHMMRDVELGWYSRVIHANGASFFFMLLYIHIGRGIYYGGYRLTNVWLSGVSIYLLSMGIAFLGYVLPWGQMSFWAATVITNLLSVVPYVGKVMVEWLWGGFAVGEATLVRFFSLHYLLPFVLLFLVGVHLVYLHLYGSSSVLGVKNDVDSVQFSSLFVVSDLLGFVFVLGALLMLCLFCPFIFMDVDNFVESNPMVTPVHIQPEWYFLFAYAILRSVPSKLGGVIALLLSVLLLYLFPVFYNNSVQGLGFYFLGKFVFWFMIFNWLLLTWAGSCEVEEPFITLSIVSSLVYFGLFLMMKGFVWVEDLLY